VKILARLHRKLHTKALIGGNISQETNYELSYQAEIKPRFIMQPDLQYIKNPSGDADTKDALVIGVRLRVGLEAFK
jgi:porin